MRKMPLFVVLYLLLWSCEPPEILTEYAEVQQVWNVSPSSTIQQINFTGCEVSRKSVRDESRSCIGKLRLTNQEEMWAGFRIIALGELWIQWVTPPPPDTPKKGLSLIVFSPEQKATQEMLEGIWTYELGENTMTLKKVGTDQTLELIR